MENVEPNAFVAAIQEALCERGRVEDDLVKQADATSIAAVMECEEVHDHLVTVLPAVFEAADPAHKASLVEAVALALVRKLDDGTLAEAPAKKCLETIGLELGALSTSHLAALLEAVLERLQSTLRAANGGPHALELLPKCLNLLATVERCDVALGDGSSAADGAAIVAYALKAILVTAWPAGCLLGLAMSLRELEVPKGQLQPLVGKMLRRLADVEVSQLPALTYQLLLLGDADGKTKVLRALNAHFDEMLAACEAAAAKDELVPTRLDPDQLGHVQGAVVLHIQLAVKQDQALGLGLLRLLKSGQLRLGPFALSLLLSLARIKRFEEPTVSAIVSLVRAELQLASHCALSPWVASFAALATACPPAKPDALLLGAVRASAAGGWDHLVPSLVALAAALLDSPPPAASAAALLPSSDDSAPADGGVPAHRLPAATRLPLLGQQMMVEVFALHPMVRAEVMDALCSRILSRGDAVHHWVALLQELVVRQPTLLLDHAPKLKQLLEYVLHLPPAVASPMLRSLLPLQRQRPELKDTLVLLLRKAMFHREEELRLTAVHGFLLLLHGTADADRPADGALQFQLELLGFIRRSFSQQASIRSVLYGGLVAAFEQQPPLRDLVAELLASQLRTYLASDPADAPPDEFDGVEAEAPLDLRACFHATTSAAGDDVVVMLEPLPDLLRAVTRCAHASDGTAAPSGAMRTLGGMVGQMVAGFCRCSLRSLGLSDKVELSQASSHSAMTLATAGMLERVLEALIEWTVLCPANVSAGGAAQEGEEAAAVTSPGPSQLTASSKLLPESARVLYKLLVDVQARLKEGRPATKAKGRKAVSIPKFGAYGLSLAACEAVLGSIASDQAVQSSGRASHFVRHVLRACEAQARRIAADAAAAIRAGQLQLSEAHLRDLRSVASIGKLLLALVPRAEAQTGKEAPSGRLGNNPLTGEKEVATPKASGSKAAGGKSGGGGRSGGGKAAAAKSGDRTAMASRLQLVLDAAGACVSALTGSPSLLPLGMMLMPTATPAAATPAAASPAAASQAASQAAGGSQAPTSVDVLALAEGHLLCELLPLAEKLAYDDSHREAEAATAIAAQLCAVLPASRLKKPLAWSAAVLRREAHLSTAVRKAFLATHLRLERASGTHRAGSLSVAKELHHLLGDNLKDEEPGERPEKLEMLEEGSANNVSATLLEAVEVELGELSQAFAHLSRVGEAARRPEADDKDKEAERAADALERALCDRYTQVVSVLRLLLKSQIEGSPAQGLLKLCTALFKQLDAVFKGVMAVDKGKKGASKRLEALLSHVCGETGVTLAMYGLLSFSTSSEDTAARVVREAKLVPALVFALEKFEATVVKLSKTSERDLLRFMKRTTARDFKIQAEEVANAIRRKEDKAEKEMEKGKGK